MTTNLGPDPLETSDRSRQTTNVVAGGSIAQAAASGAAAVLAIIGLAGTRMDLMMSIATIALGAAFLLREGGLLSHVLQSGVAGEPTFGNAVTASTIAGIAGVALGILALVDVDPAILVPAGVIVFGGSLLLDNAARNPMAFSYLQRIDPLGVTGGAAAPGAGGELLVGVGAAALGILGLIGVAPVTLSLVALLALGVSTFLVGSAIGTKVMSVSR